MDYLSLIGMVIDMRLAIVCCTICNIAIVLWAILSYLILRGVSSLFYKWLRYYLLTCSQWVVLWAIDYCSHWIISSNILAYILKLLWLAYCIHNSYLGHRLSLIYYRHSLPIHSPTSSGWLTFPVCILLYNLFLCLIQYNLLSIIFKEIYLGVWTCPIHIVYHVSRLRNILWIW